MEFETNSLYDIENFCVDNESNLPLRHRFLDVPWNVPVDSKDDADDNIQWSLIPTFSALTNRASGYAYLMWRLNKNMMVQMPTGIGKLHSLASVIHEHLQERQRQSVWIATHRRELVEQIEDTVVRYGIRKEEG